MRDFRPEDILGAKGLRLLDRTTRLALCATALALDDARLHVGDGSRVGVVLGSFMGGIESRYGFNVDVIRDGPRGVNPAHFPATVLNAPASQVSIRFGIRGFNTTISTGFTSSLEALECGARAVSSGRVDVALAGGAEELSRFLFLGFSRMGFLSPGREGGEELSAPFDRRRNGAVLGEGAAVLVLEPVDAALARGARILAVYRGGAGATDAEFVTGCQVRSEGAVRAIRAALIRAEQDVDTLGVVASGASSTAAGDAAEAQALTEALGDPGPPVSASKSLPGETVSAAGALQVAAALLTLDRGVIPAARGHQRPDPGCVLNLVTGEAMRARVDHALVVSAAPLGQSASCVLSRPGAAA